MLRPSENFLSASCIACSLVVPFVTTTVLPFRSVTRRDLRALRHHQLGAGDEHQRRECDLPGALGVGRGRSAFEVDLVLHHRRNAVVRGDLDVVDPEIGIVDLDADLLDDGLAQFEAVADRPVGVIEEGERRRTLAIAEPHGMVCLDIGERRAKPLAACGLRWRRRCQQTCCQQQAARQYRPPRRSHACISPVNGRPARHPGTASEGTTSSGRARARPSARPPTSRPRRSPASCRSRWWRCGPCRGRCRCP